MIQIIVSDVNQEDDNILFGILYDPEKKNIVDHGTNIEPDDLKEVIQKVKAMLNKYCELIEK